MTASAFAAITVAYSVMFVVAIVGNALLIRIIAKNPSMRTSVNLLLINMAVGDLLIASSMPFLAVVRTYVGSRWIGGMFGEISCRSVFFLSHVGIAGSINTLTVLAFERFIAINFPMTNMKFFRSVRLESLAIWLAAMLTMVPVGISAKTVERNGTTHCSMYWEVFGEEGRGIELFYVFTFTVLYAVPLLFVSVLYFFVGRKVWRRVLPGNMTERERQVLWQHKRQVTRMLIIVVVVFAVCWLPTHVNHFLIVYHLETYFSMPQPVRVITFFLGHVNCAINPWLCLALTGKFRSELRSLTLSEDRRKWPELHALRWKFWAFYGLTPSPQNMPSVAVELTSVNIFN